jgi:hypothetical protein
MIKVAADFSVSPSTIYFASARTREDFHSALAYALVDALGLAGGSRHRISDAVYRLLGRSPKSNGAYLSLRGIAWTPPSPSTSVEEQDEEEVNELLHSALAATLIARQPASVPSDPPAGRDTERIEKKVQPPIELPALDDVHAVLIDATPSWQASERRRRVATTPRLDWQPPTPADTARDALVGQRAEAIAFREEKQRVRARGQDPARVVWVSRDAAGADHDIRSIDAKGEPVYIEVKGTLGRDGRFHWPVDQVSLALKYRSRYQLWRVYEVGGISPPIRVFPDPIGMLVTGTLRIDVSGFGAEVEPLA